MKDLAPNCKSILVFLILILSSKANFISSLTFNHLTLLHLFEYLETFVKHLLFAMVVIVEQ